MHSLHGYEWRRNIAVLEIIFLINPLCREFLFFEILLLTISMWCFQAKFSPYICIYGDIYIYVYIYIYMPRIFFTNLLLICLFSIIRLSKIFKRKFLFERLWNNNHLYLSPFKDKSLDLIHSLPMQLLSTPWKHQKTVRFSNVFRGFRKGALGTNGLNLSWWRYLSHRNYSPLIWDIHHERFKPRRDSAKFQIHASKKCANIFILREIDKSLL